MKVLSYSPSCEAYAEVKTQAGADYYDLSDDIVSMQVVRQSMGSSNFTLKLQNKNWKYNGVFTPMDKIVLYATKDKRQKLLSGFITECDKFTLYQSDFTLKGRCSLYRIEQYYWDPGLQASMHLLWETRNTNENWAGYAQTISNLLVNVANWPEDGIYIGEIPGEAMEYARDMYVAGMDSSQQLKDRIDEFYEILRTHGPKLSSATGVAGNLSSGSGQAVWDYYMTWLGKFDYSQSGGRLDPVNSGYGDCSSTIWRAYQDVTGIDVGTWTGDMVTKGELIEKGSGDLPTEKMAVGDLIIVNHYGYNPSYDHVELFGPNDQYAGHGGPGKGPTLKQGAKAYGSTQSDWQVRRYVQDVSGGGTYTGIDMNLSESEFVSKWGPRIDRWIAANHPRGALSGHGNTIAREARKNGCDPRIIVAIAAGESGCGEVSTSGGSHGVHNYWSWGIAGMSAGIWSSTVDGAIAEYCQKFGAQYAGCSPAECAAKGYGEADYIMAHWQPVIDAI